MTNRNTRLLALETLLESEKKNIYVKDALDKTLFQNQFLSKQERSFLSRLTEGVTEYRIRLDYVINAFSKIKVNKCKPVIRMILRMGVYQMLYMDSVAKETACDECVKLTRKKGFHQLTGFVNGVLRNIAQNIDDFQFPKEEDDLILFLSVQYSVPEWLVKKIIEWYGVELTKAILEGSIGAKDLTIRVNTSLISKEELAAGLSDAEIFVTNGHYVQDALHLNHINYVSRIPGFRQGAFFVQDESSMLLCELVKSELIKGMENLKGDEKITVLDLCSAPGGKATHFAQVLLEKGEVLARDLTEQKVSLIKENMERLQLHNMILQVKNALESDETMVGKADIVIADLPCSGIGIMGKKNDIKYHLQEEQLEKLQQLQRDILENAVKYVKPGGLLLYSTCTINPFENIENARWILNHEDYDGYSLKEKIPDLLEQCLVEDNMLQLLQGREQCDGFFISAFRRK
ncbi:MAG: 16S rRNA (cytosine(967)-C(5))-methyltransferase RsmB [Lachnospiraceae bacterium]